ncbi:MAG: dihydrolipoyl dehydrogenase family protein [Oscillospiraceae bacterium]
MADYQLIVIGAGPGGYEAALRAAKLGKKVAVVERREAGGTCLNRGCIPTKTLLHASAIYRDAKNGAHCGIHTEDIHADMAEIFAYKRAVSQKLSAGIESLFKTAKIDLLRGTALITGSGCVRVADADGSANDYTCDDILIATGSVPSRPPIPGLELAMTSDELLEGCDHLYRSIVIIGGGVIGIEFATFYADLGCAVTVIEGMDRLLPNMDKELGQNLALILKKQGVKVFTNAMVQRVEQAGEDLAVHFTCKETEETVSGEAVLCAIGRRAYCDGLFADGVGVEMNGRSIAVDGNFETSLPHVYAIGDVSSKSSSPTSPPRRALPVSSACAACRITPISRSCRAASTVVPRSRSSASRRRKPKRWGSPSRSASTSCSATPRRSSPTRAAAS